MTTLDQIAGKIIKEQELIIGPVAWYEAKKVRGIHVIDQGSGTISIENGNAPDVINGLVMKYEDLFGRASREVCRDAAAKLLGGLTPSEVPSSLR